MVAPRLMAAPRLVVRGLSTDSGSGGGLAHLIVTGTGDLTADAWMELATSGQAPSLRFPLGTPVRCFVGDGWKTGTVVAHNYRDETWPAERAAAYMPPSNRRPAPLVYARLLQFSSRPPTCRCRPYQILLDDHLIHDERTNAIWAPADVDEIIQSNFRFPLGAAAECRVGKDDWVRCTVVGHLYREKKWPAGRFAPYQVRVGDVLPGSQVTELKSLARQLIWLPKDNAQNIRDFSDLRWERLQALVEQRDSGLLDAEAFAEQRRELIHDDDCSFYDEARE